MDERLVEREGKRHRIVERSDLVEHSYNLARPPELGEPPAEVVVPGTYRVGRVFPDTPVDCVAGGAPRHAAVPPATGGTPDRPRT